MEITDRIVIQINEIAHLLSGITYKKEQSSKNPGHNLTPILRANNIFEGVLNFDDLVYIPEIIVRDDQMIMKDDIVIAMSSGSASLVGKSAIAKKDYHCSFGAFCSLLRVNKSISPVYVYYYFQNSDFRKYLTDASKGTNINNLKKEHILNATIPLPPLPEQRAIVAKLETLISELDNATATLKQAKEQLKTYRQAVLKAAFTGKLTDKINSSYLKDFHNVSLESIRISVSRISSEYQKKNENFLYLDIGSIDNTRNIITSHKQYDWGNAPSRAQQIIHVNDILFSTVRTYLKNIALVDKEIYNNQICSTGLTVIRPNPEIVLNKYLFYYILSDLFIQPLNKLQTGSSYPAVRDKDVFKQLIPICNLDEQLSIVQEIESRFSIADQLEYSLDDSLSKSDALKQSLLKQAFEGKLLSEDEVEQTRQAPDWEPADVLLKRIKSKKIEVKGTIRVGPRVTGYIERIKLKNTRKEIIEILQERVEPIDAYSLWKESIHADDIDAFYEELYQLIKINKVEEVERTGKITYLRLMRNHEN